MITAGIMRNVEVDAPCLSLDQHTHSAYKFVQELTSRRSPTEEILYIEAAIEALEKPESMANFYQQAPRDSTWIVSSVFLLV